MILGGDGLFIRKYMMVKIAFSYSHTDETLRNELEKHLVALKRQGIIDTWHDRRILAGQEFNEEINRNFETADIILLLVSPDFIASDYCYNVEMSAAIEKHNAGKVKVIPIILRPCDWHDLPFGKILAATNDGKPIIHFPSYDDGFLEVVIAIKKAIKSMKSDGENQAITRNLELKSSNNNHTHNERSSNLSIRQKFTDQDKDIAKRQCFDYIAGFFQNSLTELQARHKEISSNFNRIDNNSFEATVYRDGDRVSHCGIWIENERSMSGAICYSDGGVTRSSYNEFITLQNDGYTMGFKATMGNFGNTRETLNNQGVSEHLWSMFIQRLR